MRVVRLLLAGAIYLIASGGHLQAAVSVADIVEQVSEASYRHYIDDLLYAHLGDDRGPSGPQHDLAMTNIYDHFVQLGLDSDLQAFRRKDGGTGRNVVGVYRGSGQPEDIYVVGAHYDSKSTPGADDNASGVAGLMEAARVLVRHPMAATIVFIAFDAEETGQEGAHAYVDLHSQDHILSMLNLDMIGHRAASNDTVYVLSSERTGMQDDVAAAMRTYSGGLEPVVSVQLELGDHLAFEPITDACTLARTSDNVHYHKLSDAVDTSGNIDYTYATNITRAVVGFLADQAMLSWNSRSDLDLDGAVTIADLQILVAAWGSRPGKANYNPTCDVNDDQRVDLYDLMIVVQYFGSTAP